MIKGKSDEFLLFYVDYVWKEGTANELISFKSGDARETFYDYFNARFDYDANFAQYLALLFDKISAIGPEETQRMKEMINLCEHQKHPVSRCLNL
jgi:hypothetical protein